jgi:homoserine O-acetyltransferase/O-succinyltransferase
VSALRHVSSETRFVEISERPFLLQGGGSLPRVRVAYRTWGRLDRHGVNAVLVCHALTGSADADVWWRDLLGPGKALDPERDFVVCSNVLGGCYGSTGPSSVAPSSEGGETRTWGAAFPAVSIRDMVRLQAALLDELGVRRLRLVIGGSMGGMQVLEWAALYRERVEAIVPIAVSSRHSPWCIGLHAAQRSAIRADPQWRGGEYSRHEPPAEGLAVARMIAMTSYRSWQSFGQRFGRSLRADGRFQVEAYLEHQGSKLVSRFDANSYLVLTRAMDDYDLGLSRGGHERVLEAIRQPALVVGIDSDALYPLAEQEELVRLLPAAELWRLRSPHGHDAFLIEGEALGERVLAFRRELGQLIEEPAARAGGTAA